MCETEIRNTKIVLGSTLTMNNQNLWLLIKNLSYLIHLLDWFIRNAKCQRSNLYTFSINEGELIRAMHYLMGF